ncbi:hypothetical protein [Phaeodactylibacter xiamenensis]|uniref:hypothetical protein n=1 Tax=Phaeodactylibacter xiamenensis TaxID=1524460 RepID=UPI0024A9FFDE|nr:hypothetical protein [Phaeodactylibacter xiamenensis]
MKNQDYLLTAMLTLIAIALMAVLRRPRRREPSHSPTGPADLLLADESAGRILECEYQPHHDMDTDLDVIDVINNRMRLLQRNRTSARQVREKSRANNWSYYKTLYNEALRQLLIEGMLVHNNPDACGVPEKS